MKLSKLFLALLFISSITISCKKEESTNNSSNSSSSSTTSDCQTDQSKRRGARCNDGTESTATGSGACSSHGGVDYWLCK